MRLGLVGRGRAARTLAPLLSDVGMVPTWWWSHRDNAAPASGLPTVDVVLLAVPDVAIEAAAASLAVRAGAEDEVWLHLSGSRPADVARAGSRHPRAVGCLHPLQSLPGRRVPVEHLRGVTAAIDGEPAGTEAATRIALALGMIPRALPPGTKPLYHAAAVTVCGHVTALFAQAQAMLAQCGFDEAASRAALQPLLKGTVANLAHGNPAEVATGPATRGDSATIRSHLEALEALDPHLAATYRRLTETARQLAADRSESVSWLRKPL